MNFEQRTCKLKKNFPLAELQLNSKSQYVGHFAIVTGSSPSIVNDILDYFASNEISFGDAAAAGHNSTAVNTGCIGSVKKILENYFQKPSQWLVCLLHTQQFLLRHLMKDLDGGAKGPEH